MSKELKFTIDVEIDLLERMHYSIASESADGLCEALIDALYDADVVEFPENLDNTIITEIFPELKEYVTQYRLYWWPTNKEGMLIRLQVLEKLIKIRKDKQNE